MLVAHAHCSMWGYCRVLTWCILPLMSCWLGNEPGFPLQPAHCCHSSDTCVKFSSSRSEAHGCSLQCALDQTGDACCPGGKETQQTHISSTGCTSISVTNVISTFSFYIILMTNIFIHIKTRKLKEYERHIKPHPTPGLLIITWLENEPFMILMYVHRYSVWFIKLQWACWTCIQ